MFDIAHVDLTPTTLHPVAHIATWLDACKPGWARLIDKDMLNLESSRWCVLGQVFHDEGQRAPLYGVPISGYSYIVYGPMTGAPRLPPINTSVFSNNIMYRDDWIAAIDQRLNPACA